MDDSVPFEGWEAKARELFGAPPYEDVSADAGARHVDEPPAGFFENLPGVSQQNTPSHRIFKSLTRFLSEYVPLSYAVEPIIRTGSLYTLTAKTGAGKTGWMLLTALALATGRQDLLKLEVSQGRVAYCCFENPDDIRMRLMIAAWLLNIVPDSIDDHVLILDMRASPEAIEADLKALSVDAPLVAVFVDTFAAGFDGNDLNDAVQAGTYMRRLRPLTRLPGLPAVLVAAHPVKNASEEQLVPYGSGAVLNEVDGNLTLWRKPETGIVTLHWQGKLRGLEFKPLRYRFELSGAPHVLDKHDRQIQLPTMVTASDVDDDGKEAAETDVLIAVLKAMSENPRASQRELGMAVNRSPSVVNGKVGKLKADGLVDHLLGLWELTTKGKRALERLS